MTACNPKLRRGATRPSAATCPAGCLGKPRRRSFSSWRLAAASATGAAIAFHMLPAHAQPAPPTWQPQSPQYVQCPAPGQPLLKIPELVSQNGKLRGTIELPRDAAALAVEEAALALPQVARLLDGRTPKRVVVVPNRIVSVVA